MSFKPPEGSLGAESFSRECVSARAALDVSQFVPLSRSLGGVKEEDPLDGKNVFIMACYIESLFSL